MVYGAGFVFWVLAVCDAEELEELGEDADMLVLDDEVLLEEVVELLVDAEEVLLLEAASPLEEAFALFVSFPVDG